MSDRINEDDDDAAAVHTLADVLGVVIRDEHFDEVCAAWRLMQPHLARVRETELAKDQEPAALFRP